MNTHIYYIQANFSKLTESIYNAAHLIKQIPWKSKGNAFYAIIIIWTGNILADWLHNFAILFIYFCSISVFRFFALKYVLKEDK